MGKQIDLSFAAEGQPFRAPVSVSWLQLNAIESDRSILRSLLNGTYAGGVRYILWGCELSSAGGTTNISQGAIWDGTYIYLHGGSSFADPTGGDVVVGSLVVTPSGDDPTLFGSGINHNVHLDTTIKFTAAASGSGFGDYADMVPISETGDVQAYIIDGLHVKFTRNMNIVRDEYDNTGTGVNTITLDPTNAVEGAEVTIDARVNGTGLVFTLLVGGGYTANVRLIAGTTALTNTKRNLLKIKVTNVDNGGLTCNFLVESYSYTP
jgi:hypothetical protein